MTCGPWRPVSLEIYECSISEVDIVTHVNDDLSSATINIKACVAGAVSRGMKIEFLISLHDHQVVREQVQVRKQGMGVTFTTKRPSLWYPARYGKQAMYNLTVSLFSGSNDLLHRKVRRFGLRKAKIIQRRLQDEDGTSFVVEVNDIPIFCGGSNWIPADSFLTRMSPCSGSSYQDWVTMLIQGNQMMLRVWGGGIYETDSFYDTCDELGMLVWQDLMFACGNYPVEDAFLDSVKGEVTSKFKELRNHPSIVIVAGNNEDYQIAEQEGLEYDLKDSNPASWLRTNFPARFIYESMIPDLAREHMLGVHYHPGSPWGGNTSNDPTVGDIHQWNVWHGEQLSYQQWDKLSGRFVSEFGMQALPAMSTVEHFFTDDSAAERYPESSTVSFHNKAIDHDRRLGAYLTENLRYRFDPFGYYVYCTQLMQAECIASAFRLWKRQWKGPGREYCAGALVWQANDCWPCTSWSIVDYYLRPKLAYYAVKREMDPMTMGMKRTVTSIPEDEHTRAFVRITYKIELWICNLTLETQELTVSIKTFNLDNRSCETHVNLRRNLEASPNRSKEVMNFDIPVRNQGVGEEEQTIVYAIVTNKKGQVITDTMNWPEPLKFAHIPKPKLSICLSAIPERLPCSQEHESVADKGSTDLSGVMWLNISTDVPVKGFAIDFEGHDNRGSNVLDDNGFDVFPDQTITKRVRGLETVENPRARIRYLGSDSEEFHNLKVVGTANTTHYVSQSLHC